ncbi:N-acetyltransferase [Brachybacterium sp. EF45031]|uniref:GNAT family N-acetyltransferase n=1 Tax=Brachybacterium sillae TaxID=2810536 RepID=UPI00217E9B19|nr:GNAT family N-acetyltransferase [Brachybacterium sillae]MCS6711138.1 N-acetyltransferase [Brachybacterium sillae]
MTATVRDDENTHRYVIEDGGEIVGFARYTLTGDRIAVVHTEVPEEHQGKGYAGVLVREMLADIRERVLGLLPYCPLVRRTVAKHPDQYLDLVPADARDEFDLPADA